MNRLWIDGIEFTDDAFDGLDAVEVEFSVSENRKFSYSTSSEILLKGDAYEYIKNKFFNDCENADVVSSAKYYSELYDLTLDFEIAYGDVEISYDCTAAVTLTNISDTKMCLETLGKTAYWQEGFHEKPVRLIEYCVHGQYAVEIMYFITPFLFLIMGVLRIICEAIRVITEIIDAILSPLRSIFGAIGSFFSNLFGGSDGFEYRGEDFDNLEGETCAEILAGLTYNEKIVRISDQDIQLMCSRQVRCSDILIPAIYNLQGGELSDDDRERIDEFCEFLQNRINLDFIGDYTNEDNGFFNISCDWADPCGILNYIHGCDRWVQAPSVYDIIEHHLNICGFSVDMPIIDKNWSLLELANEGGVPRDEIEGNGFILKAASTMTVMDIIDKMKSTFNSDFLFIDNVFYFDTVDNIDAAKEKLFNISDKVQDGCLLSVPKLSYVANSQFSYMRVSYCDDFIETEGKSVDEFYGDGEITEWNPERSKHKDGEYRADLQFAPSRFMFDRKSYDSRGLFGWDFILDDLRKSGDLNTFGTVVTGLTSGLVGLIFQNLLFKACQHKTDGSLLLSGNRTSCPKLLYIDESSPLTNSKVVRREWRFRNGHVFYEYNFPYFGAEGENMHNLHETNRRGRYTYRMDDLTWVVSKRELLGFIQNGVGFYVEDMDGRQIILDTVTVNLDNGEGSAQGFAKC